MASESNVNLKLASERAYDGAPDDARTLVSARRLGVNAAPNAAAITDCQCGAHLSSAG